MKTRGALILCCLLVGLAGATSAQSSKLLTLIVPTTPGTAADIAARLLAPELSTKLGQTIVVENRTGASGAIGIGAVARAPADGNTLLFTAGTIAMLSSVSKTLAWDPVKDFAPIAQMGRMISAVVVAPQLPVNSLQELIVLARSKPGALNYATPGAGTPHHLRTEQLKLLAGIDMTHVSYKGTAGAVTDLAAGQVQVGIFPVNAILPMASTGRLRILVTNGETRSQWTPDVPTFREAGYSNLNEYDWIGVFAPKNTPAARIDTVSRELQAILRSPSMQKELAARGVLAAPSGPRELAALLQTEMAEWRTVVEKAGINAD